MNMMTTMISTGKYNRMQLSIAMIKLRRYPRIQTVSTTIIRMIEAKDKERRHRQQEEDTKRRTASNTRKKDPKRQKSQRAGHFIDSRTTEEMIATNEVIKGITTSPLGLRSRSTDKNDKYPNI